MFIQQTNIAYNKVTIAEHNSLYCYGNGGNDNNIGRSGEGIK